MEMDLSSLSSVKNAIKTYFKHSRLDILINNAGIMGQPPSLSVDGYEIQFATNHLGHSMVTKQLLPTLLKTSEDPDADVRVITRKSHSRTCFAHVTRSNFKISSLLTRVPWTPIERNRFRKAQCR